MQHKIQKIKEIIVGAYSSGLWKLDAETLEVFHVDADLDHDHQTITDTGNWVYTIKRTDEPEEDEQDILTIQVQSNREPDDILDDADAQEIAEEAAKFLSPREKPKKPFEDDDEETYKFSEAERWKLRELIQDKVEEACGGFSRFNQEERIYFHIQDRDFQSARCGEDANCTTGYEEDGYTFLCAIPDFEDENPKLTEDVGCDPADRLLDMYTEQAEGSLWDEWLMYLNHNHHEGEE